MTEPYRPDVYGVKKIDRLVPWPRRDALFVLSQPFEQMGYAPEEKLALRSMVARIRRSLGPDAMPRAVPNLYTRGVEWDTVIVSVAAAWLLGPKLRDAVLAWGDMARMVVSVWKRLKRKNRGGVLFHPAVAGPIALDHLREHRLVAPRAQLRVDGIMEIPLHGPPGDPFRYTPERVYVVAVWEIPRGHSSENETLHVLTMTSCGHVISHAAAPVEVGSGPSGVVA